LGLKPQATEAEARDSHRELVKSLGLQVMYLPKVCALEYFKVFDQQHYVAYLPDGKIVDSGPHDPGFKIPDGGLKRKFKTIKEPLDRFRLRVRALYYLTRTLSEKGISDKAYKTLKRVNLVAFTCKLTHLRKMVNKIVRENNQSLNTFGKVLAAVPEVKSWSNPFFMEETKTILKLNGIKVHLWTRVRKRPEPSRQYEVW